MTIEAKKKEVIAAIEQLQDESALTQIEAILVQAATPQGPVRAPGFARGMVTYMADDFDEPLDDMKEYM